jgi:RimJ/RimL family protein N-acetyltransferase
VLRTTRLNVRRLEPDDAPFVLELLNEPGWIANIGDRGIRTVEGARRYVEDGPIAMYRERGFGLYVVEIDATGEPIGFCGLIKRATLDDVDLGFALLERHWGNGYAFEAASALMAREPKGKGLARVVAIVTPSNARSRALLEKLGFAFERMIQSGDDAEELALYAIAIP